VQPERKPEPPCRKLESSQRVNGVQSGAWSDEAPEDALVIAAVDDDDGPEVRRRVCRGGHSNKTAPAARTHRRSRTSPGTAAAKPFNCKGPRLSTCHPSPATAAAVASSITT